jgi:hypothetical protein
MHALMPDWLSKATRFCTRAEECTKLAELTTKNKMRRHYKRIAERYLAMARAELIKAENIARTEGSPR